MLVAFIKEHDTSLLSLQAILWTETDLIDLEGLIFVLSIIQSIIDTYIKIVTFGKCS